MDQEKFKSYLAQKDHEYQALQLEANRLELPVDVIGVISSWVKYAELLPDNLDQKKIILKQLRQAEIQFENGNIEKVKLCLLRAQKNFENSEHDDWVNGISEQFGKDAEARRRQVIEEDEPRWKEWREAGELIKSESSRNMSKRELAVKIKALLNLTCSMETIRKRI